MKIAKYAILLIITLILLLSGCSSPERISFLNIFGREIFPDDIVTVGEKIDIMLKTQGGTTKDGVYEIYHWNITGFNEINTAGNALVGIKFDTPGPKNVMVYVTSNNPEFKTNIYSFTIDVLANE